MITCFDQMRHSKHKTFSCKCFTHCIRTALHRIIITHLLLLNSELAFNAMPVSQHYTKTNSTLQTSSIMNINAQISYKKTHNLYLSNEASNERSMHNLTRWWTPVTMKINVSSSMRIRINRTPRLYLLLLRSIFWKVKNYKWRTTGLCNLLESK